MSTSNKRKARATRLEAILGVMDDLARRVARYQGAEAACLLQALTEAREAWAVEAPQVRPGRRPAYSQDLIKGVTAYMVENSEWTLQNPLTVTEDATTGRPTRACVVDAAGARAFIEARYLQVARSPNRPA